MVFVKVKNDCRMAAKWILGNKKGRRKKRRPKQNGAKTLGRKKKHKNSKYSRRAKKYGAIRQAV